MGWICLLDTPELLTASKSTTVFFDENLFYFSIPGYNFGYEFRHEAFGLTLSEAQGECESFGIPGNLISIQNKDENDFIFKQLNKRYVFLNSVQRDIFTYSQTYEKENIFTSNSFIFAYITLLH